MNLNLHQVLCILELAGTFTCTWPVDSNASRWKIILRDIRWMFAMINVIVFIISLGLGIYHDRNDLVVLTKTISEFTALLEVLLDLVLCKMNSAQLQVLIKRVRMYLETAGEHENNIIQNYVDRYKKFFSVVAIMYVSNGISFSFVPIFSKQVLPAEGWIPFSIESIGTYCTVYFIHVYCILLTSFCIGVDFMITALFCFTAARLDILGTKLKQVSCPELLVSCIKEHQEIIGFLEETKVAVTVLLFKTNITMGSAVICAGFPLLYLENQPLAVASQFLCIIIAGCGHMYLISWPADDLKESSLRFAISVNDIQWIGKSREMTSGVLIMMQRSQKPFQITMGGLFPAFSLEYFSQFLTTISSYFMGMRTVIES